MGSNSGGTPGVERDESGRFTSKFPDEDFLAALEAEDGMAGTTDVAEYLADEHEDVDEVDATLESITYKNLKRLCDDGDIDRKKVGNTNVWMLLDVSQQ